jgi:uncharacterized phage-associated protein
MTYPASLIAYAFIRKGIDEGKPVTQMKLQKIVFFAHGYHLAKYGEPLIQEDFEAWQFGPVVPDIYNEYKMFGRDPIRLDKKALDEQLATLSPEARHSIDFSWNATKNLSAATLSTWTHKKGSPWEMVYKPYSISIPIDNHVIGGYFKNLIEKAAQNQQSHDNDIQPAH